MLGTNILKMIITDSDMMTKLLLEAGEVDSTDLYDLYNEVALAEAMVLDPKNSFH